MRKRKSTVLVTGGAGFIGSHVAQELLRLGYRVIVLDDLSGGYEDNLPAGAVFVKGSILDIKLIDRLFQKYRFAYVFHLAAYAAEGLSHFIKRFNYTNNLIGSINLINAAVNYKIKGFVFTSSIAVYGHGQLPYREDTIPMPEDPYGIAKWAVELELKASYRQFGLPYIIFRPHNVFGPKQNIADKYRNVIGIFMNNIMQNKPLIIFGDGEQSRAFSDISSVAPVIACSIENPKCWQETFNIGADKTYTVNALAKAVSKAMGQEAQVKHVEARNEVKHAYADHRKMVQFFGPSNGMELDQGLQAMAQWVRQSRPRRLKDFESIEIHQRMPSSWTKKLK